MTATRLSRFARLRALCAALGLLLGAVAAPVALASNAADVCAMACCVTEGHCCCTPRRAHVEGQTTDGSPGFTETEVSAPCPEGCTLPSAAANFIARDALRTPAYHIHFITAAVIGCTAIITKHSEVQAAASSPRAPPVLSSNLIA
jgi:hypothetical protein